MGAVSNMKTVVLVHGFNVKDGGEDTIDMMKDFLVPDFNVVEADYGHLGLFGVRMCGKNIARMIASMTPSGAVGIGHSNGCMELVRAVEFGAPFKHLILINPALDKDYEFPESLERIDILHNVDDNVVRVSKFLIGHRWGGMGRVGYQGSDIRAFNHETKALWNVSGHSAVFSVPFELTSYVFGLVSLGPS